MRTLLAIALLAGSCAPAATQTAVEPEPAPTVVVTVTATPTPTPVPTPTPEPEPEPEPYVAADYYPGADPATGRQIARALFDEHLPGSRISEEEMVFLGDAYVSIHRQAWDEGGDADARFVEFWYERYKHNIQMRKDQEQARQNRERWDRNQRCMSAMARGEECEPPPS